MKKQVLFIHSAGPQEGKQGSSQLIAYLQKSLRSDYHFSSPEMPDPDNPRYDPWKNELQAQLSELKGSPVILIGHSLGGSVLLKYLSEEYCDLSISGLFVIGSPYWGLDDWRYKEFELSDDFAARLPQISQIYLYHSCNDEVVPFSHFEHYAYKLPNAKKRIFENYGHLFQGDLPELIHDIEAVNR
ncbi:alpha/beta fold hydrolase [Pseudalkalibacillus sp. R45]|uniref:alpha/beta fold hydrolase n=1 Tax=Pseudalkalibacillus sp. R45 TaxID=3457433 RepID=UPI003FCDCB5C